MRALFGIAVSVFALGIGCAVALGGLAFLGEAKARPTLEAFAQDIAFAVNPDPASIAAARAADPAGSLAPDGRLFGAAALAALTAGERTGGAAAFEEARRLFRKQAKLAPRDPYLWAGLAWAEDRLNASPDRVLALVERSRALGRNAVASWPARVALGFKHWAAASPSAQAATLAEAERIWRKQGDRFWSRPDMRNRLAALALATGGADRLASAFASRPDDFAQWTAAVRAAALGDGL